MKTRETFSSRWTLILATLGMVVGTGNIWRFPRIVAKNGGGSFLIAWFIFLILWSIPLLISEFAIGKKVRMGTVGAFISIMNPKYAWMGAFIGFCTTAIMFYYSVVMGWCLKYFTLSLIGVFHSGSTQEIWNGFIQSRWQPSLFHVLAISLGAWVVLKGIKNGIEQANKILIPLLLLILITAAIYSLGLPGAVEGLNFFFTPSLEKLLDHRLWLEALSQSAWSTGAGWGLILTLAVYMKKNEDVVLNSFLAGLGNNAASLLVGLTIFSAVFAIAPQLSLDPMQIVQETGPANTGMAFIWMPQLFAQMPMGTLFAVIFFLALSIAAMTSIIAMLELGTTNLLDAGISRTKAVTAIWVLAILFGLPSANDMTVFENQDWVWGLGLLVSGFFFALAIIHYNPKRFRQELINTEDNDIPIGAWYDIIIRFVIPTEFIILLAWWFYQAMTSYEPKAWWHPFRTFSVGTCIFQWSVIIIFFILVNRKIVAKITGNKESI